MRLQDDEYRHLAHWRKHNEYRELPFVEAPSHQDSRRLGCRVKVTCFTINAFKNSVILVYRAVSLDKWMIEIVEICIAGHSNLCR
jgi:hypothetical protein